MVAFLCRGPAVTLSASLPSVYEMTERELQLEATMVEQMTRLSSAEFERVLHPVFEEDEWTLIRARPARATLPLDERICYRYCRRTPCSPHCIEPLSALCQRVNLRCTMRLVLNPADAQSLAPHSEASLAPSKLRSAERV